MVELSAHALSTLSWACGILLLMKLLSLLRPWVRGMTLVYKLPHAPFSSVAGHTSYFTKKDRHTTVLEWSKTYGAIFSTRLLWVPMVIVTDPVLVHKLLQEATDKPVEAVHRKTNVITSDRSLPGLFSSHTNDHWRLVRKGTRSAFNMANLRAGFPHMLQVLERVSSILSATGTETSIDMDRLFQRASLDMIGLIGFSKDFGATMASEGYVKTSTFDVLSACLEEVSLRMMDPLREIKLMFKGKKEADTMFAASQTTFKLLLKDIKARGEPDESDQSLSAHLMRLRDPKTNRGLPDEQLLPELGTFFVAGYDTTGHTTGWALYRIVLEAGVQDKVCAELAQHGLLASPENPQPRSLTHEDISQLTYLSCVLKESMRMTPIGEMVSRMCLHDLVLGEHKIPAGMSLLVNIVGMHRNPSYWPEPDSFKPERWLEADVEYYIPPTPPGATGPPPRYRRYMPFMAGVRDCIGQNMARMSMVTMLAYLLGRFRFELDEKKPVQEAAGFVIQPLNGIYMRAIPRTIPAAR